MRCQPTVKHVIQHRAYTSLPPPPPPPRSPRPPQTPEAYAAYRAAAHASKNRAVMMYALAVIVMAGGATYAAVPLYRAFCAATGFAGTPMVGTGRFDPDRLVPVEVVAGDGKGREGVRGVRRIRVHFNADKADTLKWEFKAQQKFVDVLPGETSLAFYRAHNYGDKDVVGIATYNVTPDRIAPYFSKVECFCFEEQRLLAGEEVDMPLLFFIDRDFLDDPACRSVDDVVLSYTFFRARRNQHGYLEPDADADAIQESLGFGGYENLPAKTGASTEVGAGQKLV
ncbi:hypothetical protein FIBSPDRAFT_734583 [Athelia psychrophila]|uniref:Cytochrome oxidase assembly factor n=1 Tax=Athelia psychrophila TaxID=1759441 RepID=A0A166NNR8_9AGAM|nr:hypothetical protein FIBSPDRAFT_734583 [Fibularhizoctonia sp. CBS 109695]